MSVVSRGLLKICFWICHEKSFRINHEKVLAKFLRGAPGVAKWMWCPKGREGVSEIPFIRAHIENGYDIVENSQHKNAKQ